jgi:hypothetical protein
MKLNLFKQLFTLFMGTSFLACQSPNNTPTDLKILSPKALAGDSTFYLSEIIDDVKIISLQTANAPVIGQIDKLINKGDRIYVFSRQMSQPILVYDLEGQFIRAIGQNGNGPFEHSLTGDFDVDEQSGDLYLLDIGKKKIIKFNAEGQGLQEHTLSMSASNITFKDNHIFLESYSMLDSSGNSILVLDKAFQTVQGYFPTERTSQMRMGKSMSSMPNSTEILLNRNRNDTLYVFDKENFGPRYVLDFGENKATAEDFALIDQPHEDIMFQHKYLKEKNLTLGVSSAFESSRYLVSSYSLGTVLHWLIYDKKEDILHSPNLIIDDVSYLSAFMPNNIQGDKLIDTYNTMWIEITLQNLAKNIPLGLYADKAKAEEKLTYWQSYIANKDLTQEGPLVRIFTLKK